MSQGTTSLSPVDGVPVVVDNDRSRAFNTLELRFMDEGFEHEARVARGSATWVVQEERGLGRVWRVLKSAEAYGGLPFGLAVVAVVILGVVIFRAGGAGAGEARAQIAAVTVTARPEAPGVVARRAMPDAVAAASAAREEQANPVVTPHARHNQPHHAKPHTPPHHH